MASGSNGVAIEGLHGFPPMTVRGLPRLALRTFTSGKYNPSLWKMLRVFFAFIAHQSVTKVWQASEYMLHSGLFTLLAE
jgi:hypothetical protein